MAARTADSEQSLTGGGGVPDSNAPMSAAAPTLVVTPASLAGLSRLSAFFRRLFGRRARKDEGAGARSGDAPAEMPAE